MSRREHAQRCRDWLEQQSAELASLHNAHPRDPGFKSWRQNTLTVLQRIWPGETARSERFRRIPFTPPQGKYDDRAAREWFGRGCGETAAYLRSMLERIDMEGVPDAHAALPEAAPNAATAREDDFPVLELPSGNAGPGPGVTALPDLGEIELDLGAAPSAVIPGSADRPVDDAGTPSPPRLKVEWKAPIEPASAPGKPPSRERGVVQVNGPQRPKQGRGFRSKKGAARPRLRDMLGLDELESLPRASTRDAAEAPPAPPEAPPAPPEAASPPPVAAKPEPQPFHEGSIVTSEPRPLKKRPKRVESLESFISPEFRRAAPASGPGEAANPAEAPASPPQDEATIDPEAFSRAARDFMVTSPVLGLQGRPVVRQSDTTGLTDPDAIAIATLAADVARLGVPEGLRASARAQMLDLARRIEAGEATWAMLRDAVTFAMDFPELAKRLLPVLLPWLDRAA